MVKPGWRSDESAAELFGRLAQDPLRLPCLSGGLHAGEVLELCGEPCGIPRWSRSPRLPLVLRRLRGNHVWLYIGMLRYVRHMTTLSPRLRFVRGRGYSA